MTLPGDSSFPAEYREKLDECDSVGPALRNLVEKNILPRDIMTRAAFENAMVRIAHLKRFADLIQLSHDLTTGIDDDPWRFYKCCITPHCHRAFCGHQPHNRRFPIRLGPRSIHRRSQTKRQIRYGRRVQDWRNPWFVIFSAVLPPFSGDFPSFLLETAFLFENCFLDLSAFVSVAPETVVSDLSNILSLI